MSPRRPLVVLSIAVLAGACLTAPASADRGVALDLSRVTITDRLLPGGGYRLPVFGVRNPGDERARYRMAVSIVTGQAGRQPPSEWFRFAPAGFSLGPGRSRPVQVRLDLPAGADPGDYAAIVGPQLLSSGGGAQVGAGAAAHVSFTVEPSTLLEAYWLEVRGFLGRHMPWTWAVPLALTLLTTGWFLRGRFTLTVARRA